MPDTVLAKPVRAKIRRLARPAGKPPIAMIRCEIDIAEHSEAITDLDPAIGPFLDSDGTSRLILAGQYRYQRCIFRPMPTGSATEPPEPECSANGTIDKINLTKVGAEVRVDFRLLIQEPETIEEDDGTWTEVNLAVRRGLSLFLSIEEGPGRQLEIGGTG